LRSGAPGEKYLLFSEDAPRAGGKTLPIFKAGR